MEIQASRTHARTNSAGEPILLADQDRTRWDHALIRHGLAELQRAERLNDARSPYALQAAIAACHARANTAEQTDWPRIATLYAWLAQLMPSPIVELNRAVAVSMAFGPQAGLDIVESLTSDPALKSYHLLPAVRADLLKKLGRLPEAQAEFVRAASLAQNSRERTLLLTRAASCAGDALPS
jgi:predicted RNA polymerase sigma factor